MKRKRPSLPVVPESNRASALAALRQIELFISNAASNPISAEDRESMASLRKEVLETRRLCLSLLAGLLSDRYTPCELFKPWASKARFQQWRHNPAVQMDVMVRHARLCVRPSSFFAHWDTMPDETKSRKKPGEADKRSPGA